MVKNKFVLWVTWVKSCLNKNHIFLSTYWKLTTFYNTVLIWEEALEIHYKEKDTWDVSSTMPTNNGEEHWEQRLLGLFNPPNFYVYCSNPYTIHTCKYFLVTREKFIYALYFHCMSIRMQKCKHWSIHHFMWVNTLMCMLHKKWVCSVILIFGRQYSR